MPRSLRSDAGGVICRKTSDMTSHLLHICELSLQLHIFLVQPDFILSAGPGRVQRDWRAHCRTAPGREGYGRERAHCVGHRCRQRARLPLGPCAWRGLAESIRRRKATCPSAGDETVPDARRATTCGVLTSRARTSLRPSRAPTVHVEL